MKSYLFVTWEGGGNVAPVLNVAASLLRRGHRVRVLAEPCLEREINRLGAQYIPFQKHFVRTDRAIDLIQDHRAGPLKIPSIENILVRPAMDVALETQAALSALQTDVLVADFMMLGALIAAEAEGIKRVALFHMPEYLPGPGRPPGGMGLLPSNSLLGKVRDRLLARVFYQVLKQYLKPLNEVRAKFALAPWSSLVDVYHQADLRLIQTCEAFDAPIIPSPKNVRYVGPVLEDPGWSESYACRPLKKDGRPLVVVSLSTTFQNQKPVLQKIISAFAHLEADCLVTLGPAMMNETFDAPENVQIMEGAPHNQLFPLADAVVTHAGHGTVMRALAHGLPIVCLPMGRDQNDNAALAAHHGAGIRLSRKTGAGKIAQAIEQVLHDPQFKNAALSLQEKIQKDVSENRAVQHLEALAGTLKT